MLCLDCGVGVNNAIISFGSTEKSPRCMFTPYPGETKCAGLTLPEVMMGWFGWVLGVGMILFLILFALIFGEKD